MSSCTASGVGGTLDPSAVPSWLRRKLRDSRGSASSPDGCDAGTLLGTIGGPFGCSRPRRREASTAGCAPKQPRARARSSIPPAAQVGPGAQGGGSTGKTTAGQRSGHPHGMDGPTRCQGKTSLGERIRLRGTPPRRQARPRPVARPAPRRSSTRLLTCPAGCREGSPAVGWGEAAVAAAAEVSCTQGGPSGGGTTPGVGQPVLGTLRWGGGALLGRGSRAGDKEGTCTNWVRAG